VIVNDEKLIRERLLHPDTRYKAFEMVVKQYNEQLYWTIRRIVLLHDDANDVLQNVFIKAWSNLDQFRNESKLSTWLYRIAINESLDFVRKKSKQSIVDNESLCSDVYKSLIADKYFDGDDAEARLQEAISNLPEVQRTVFNLRYYNDMKYSEISKILSTTEGALKASYHIAVKKISEYLKLFD